MTCCQRHTNPQHAKKDTETTVRTKEYKLADNIYIYIGKTIWYQILQGRASQSSELFDATKREPSAKFVVDVNGSVWVIHLGCTACLRCETTELLEHILPDIHDVPLNCKDV